MNIRRLVMFALCLAGSACAGRSAPPPVPAAAEAPFKPLFDGRSLTGWTSYLEGIGADQDPDRVFQMKDGVLRMYADAEPGSKMPFGYLATKDEYGDFHLRLEFRWGTKKFAPRTDVKRDSGILYRVVAHDEVWPSSIECQIQEGDVGDIFTIDTRVAAEVLSGGGKIEGLVGDHGRSPRDRHVGG